MALTRRAEPDAASRSIGTTLATTRSGSDCGSGSRPAPGRRNGHRAPVLRELCMTLAGELAADVGVAVANLVPLPNGGRDQAARFEAAG